MNLGIAHLTKSWSMPTSTVTSCTGGGVSDQFPVGLRVLIVDDDSTCLMILEKMLQNCHYQVTKCDRAEVALSKLRENKIGFDIVISDVHMPDMDGFKLLEHIGLEMDLPVIMMSADDSNSVVMKGVTHGACDYLIKPVRIEALKNIWQHVVRKKKYEWKDLDQSGSVEDGEQPPKTPGDADYSSSANEGDMRNSKRGKEEEAEDRDDSSSLKKPRVVWSSDLHQQFMAAVGQLGVDKAVPKKILELMDVPGLTRENVASHLQKYRLYMKRVSGPQQNGLNSPFAGTPDATFGSVSSLNSFDLPALTASGQLPAQSLPTLQAAALGRSTIKSPVSPLDQRNLFSFENPIVSFVEGQPHQLTNNNKQLDFLHGIPTNMEPKQLANLHQTAYSFGGISMPINSRGSQSKSVLAQMPQSRGQIQYETNGSFVSRISSSIGQPVLSNETTGGVFQRSGLVDNVGVSVYNQVSQPSPVIGFSISHIKDVTSNSNPLGCNSGISSLTSNELHQLKSRAWGLPDQHVNIQGNHDASSTILSQQGYSCCQNVGQYRSSSISNIMVTGGEASGQRNAQNIGQQQFSAYLNDNSQRVKAERFPEANYQSVLPEQFGEDDLFNLLKLEQEAIGGVEHEFGFDGYAI